MRECAVKVLVHTGSKVIGVVKFARVPCVGEFISTRDDGLLVVERVVHETRKSALSRAGVLCVKVTADSLLNRWSSANEGAREVTRGSVPST